MSFWATLGRLAQASAELAVGGMCAGCGDQPGLLCPECRYDLTGPAMNIGNVPGMPEVPLVGTAPYGGVTSSVIIGHKEHGRLPLARPLGDALAVAVTTLAASACDGDDGLMCLVPVPSSRVATRRRGHDPLLRMARRSVVTLRRAGQDGKVVPALRHVRRVADQAALGRQNREENLRGALSVRPAAAELLHGGCTVVVDDVVTTGASLREGIRALRRAGLQPSGAAVVAVAG